MLCSNCIENKKFRKLTSVFFYYFRGALRALPMGVMIAIPSGAGVALSVLGGKVGSLVGVAISASLLPPAVNAVSVRMERREG